MQTRSRREAPPRAGPPQLLLGRNEVAGLIGCSARHVDRLAASGRMPTPVRLGGLVRWSVAEITRWIEAGCPACVANPRRTQ